LHNLGEIHLVEEMKFKDHKNHQTKAHSAVIMRVAFGFCRETATTHQASISAVDVSNRNRSQI
jgi:hypothetical protein